MVREETDKNSSNIEGLIVYGQKFGLECQKQLNEEKNSNGLSRNRSSTTLEKMRGICFINLDGVEVKESISKCKEKLEIPMEAMPFKMKTTKSSCTHREIDGVPNNSNNIPKSKRACIVEADESTRKRLQKLCQKIMKIALQERVTILCTSFIQCPKQ